MAAMARTELAVPLFVPPESSGSSKKPAARVKALRLHLLARTFSRSRPHVSDPSLRVPRRRYVENACFSGDNAAPPEA